jgi:anti-sigma factor ChrR (cupin superfamily)
MRHGLPEDELRERAALYALGAMTMHEARAFEEHLGEGCDVCAAEWHAFASVVGQLGFEAVPQAPSPAAREKLFARLANETTTAPRPAASSPAAQSNLITLKFDEGQWQEIAAGVSIKWLFEDHVRGTTSFLLKLSPGARVPTHQHRRIEECTVIEGDFIVNDEVLGPGDYQCALAGSLHDNLTSRSGALVLIVSAEKYEGLRR